MANIDVFISRKKADEALANELYHYLIDRGLNVFESDQTLPLLGSSDYRKAIDKALDECTHMVVVGSSIENISKTWVEAEWGFFIGEKRAGRKIGNILTVITNNLNIGDLPASLRYYEVIYFDKLNFQRIAAYLGKDLKDVPTHIPVSPKPVIKSVPQYSEVVQQQYIPQGNTKVSEVPQSIRFGNELLTIPTFTNAGLNRRLFYLGLTRSSLSVGKWVNRGEKLLEITVHIYSKKDKPKYFWNKDYTYLVSFSLTSPASGLVIGMQEEYVGFITQHSMGMEPLVYGKKDVFPVLLIPKDEPPLNEFELTYFYENFNKLLNDEWPLIKYSHRDKGYVRLKDVFSEKEVNSTTQTLKELSIRNIYDKSDYRLGQNIQNLRTQYLDLRDKLVHLL